MKKQLTNTFTVVALSLFSFSSLAQTDKTVNQFEKRENGTPAFVSFKENTNYKNTDYLTLFRNQLGLKQNQDFSKVKSEIDELGYAHEKFQLYHQGIKVEFATYSIHSKKGIVKSMSGEFHNIDEMEITPSISSDLALEKAKAYIGATKYLWENVNESKTLNYSKPTGELVILPVEGEKFKLAYKFDIYASMPVSRGDLYVDAKTGVVLFYNASIKHLGNHSHGKGLVGENKKMTFTPFAAATAATRYSGSQTIETTLSGSSYILQGTTRGGGIQTYNMNKGTSYTSAVNFTDADNNWTAAEFNNTNKDNAALDAHWGAEKTYDYWKNIHNRNSYNNSGAKINSYVHYSSAYNNAYWDGTRMTYGDGSGSGGFNALTSLDVCGHEIGHAVCTNTANLTYSNESGAMNEGFSDIWAACIENYSNAGKQIWLIGEDIELRSGHVALRSMSNPKAEGQPDTYKGTNWYTGTADSGGVHTNSGVLNHWFYILSVGKSGTNDKGSAYNVTGITIAKAEKIAFRLESVYLSASSTYANARTGAIQAATDLYGAGSAEVIATTDAWYAVGVGAAFSGGSDTTAPSTPSNLVASGTTSTSTNLSWTASTDNVGVTGYNVYNGTTLVTSSTTNSVSVTGLTASTTYSFSVKAKDAAGNLSASSNTVSVTTSAGGVSYCASTSSNTNDERINKVVFGTINNTSTGTAGYENFSSQSTNVTAGSAYTITITPLWTATIYSEGYAVWIDYNKNGVFTDAGELVFSKAASKTTPVSGSITIPSSASLGSTRMRVSMKYNAIPTSCESFTYGQVEDYTVNIVAPFAITNLTGDNSSISDLVLYPNPATDILSIQGDNLDKSSYQIFNLKGQLLKSGNLIENNINISELSSGLYLFELNDGVNKQIKKFVKQ